MTEIIFYKDEKNLYRGFEANGHADYAKNYGEDIVCSAISVLCINAINSIEKFTNAKVVEESADEESGHIRFLIEKYESSDVQLLFSSLVLGLKEIEKGYKKHLKLTNRRYYP